MNQQLINRYHYDSIRDHKKMTKIINAIIKCLKLIQQVIRDNFLFLFENSRALNQII